MNIPQICNLHYENNNVLQPEISYSGDVGINFFVPRDINITLNNKKNSCLFSLRVVVEFFDQSLFMVIKEKSGVSTKKGLIVGASVIDNGYSGFIHVHLIKVDNSIKKVEIKPDTQIVQGIILKSPFLQKEKNKSVKIRSNKGFGSSYES